ncbi:MAG: hypothetical protein ABIJ73_08560 [Pseudomonadota bacterium]
MQAVRFIALWLLGMASHFFGLLLLIGTVGFWHFPSMSIGVLAIALGFVCFYFTSALDKARFWAFAPPAGITLAWLALKVFSAVTSRRLPQSIAAEPELVAHFQREAELAPFMIGVLAMAALPLVFAASIFSERATLTRNQVHQEALRQPPEQ